MGRFNEAEKYYHRLLDELPANDFLRIGLYHNLGDLTDQKGDHNVSLKWYQKSLKLANEIYPRDYASIVNTYKNIWLAYQKEGVTER
ncbi:unnamed protein product, partial [Rotaria sp. Silwood2]